MLIAFRADATPALGGGHVMRCLALAGELASRSCEVLFLSGPQTATVVPSLTRAGYPLAAVGADPAELGRAMASLGRPRADAMVIDGYGFSDAYERAGRDFANKIMVIDDFNSRRHDCDILLDQTFGRQPGEFDGLLPAGGIVLTGSRYALLRSEFARLREQALARRRQGAPVRRILVSMGLTDVGGLSWPIGELLARRKPDCTIDLVLGAKTTRAGQAHPSIRLHVDPPSMAELMLEADLAIGAAGSTTWERCCLGLPGVLVALADNQRLNARNVVAAGAALEATASAAAIVEAAQVLIMDDRLRTDMAWKAAEICDGYGAKRVADVLLGPMDA